MIDLGHVPCHDHEHGRERGERDMTGQRAAATAIANSVTAWIIPGYGVRPPS